MKTILTIFALALPLLAETAANTTPSTNGTEVEYQAGDVTAQGYLALPAAASADNPVPGVIVVHEWWGHNDYARKRADMLANLGYAAFALDMYGKGKSTTHPKDAGSFAKEATGKLDTMKTRFLAGMEVLQKHPAVKNNQIASIGYCMGGKISLQMAALNLDNLVAAASFHGALNIEVPGDTETIQPLILVCHGADDSFISSDTLAEFKNQMTEHNANFTFKSYDGAVHGFTNPAATKLGKEHGLNLAYNKTADEASWDELKKLLKKAFP